MPQSLVKNFIHIIYSTKFRDPCLTKEVQPQLFAYLAGTLNGVKCQSFMVGGHSDHIHALCLLNKNMTIPRLIEEMKTESTKWLKRQYAGYSEFHWQGGYGAFSVSASNMERVRNYIRNQEKHHQTMTFQEEFLKFLKEYGVEYDERYLWD